MNNKSKLVFPLLFFATILMISSCKTPRSVMKKPLKEYGFEYLYSKMTENQFKFTYLDARFSMTYSQGKKSTDLKGQLRIKNDSLTWLSFSPALGIEAARIVLTNDSIKFINRLSKTYFIGRYNLVDSLIGTTIDYAILQAMIIGNDLNQYDVNKYKSSIDGDLYKITIQERQKIKKELKSDERKSLILIQNIWLDPESFKIRKVELKELADNNRRLQVFYNNYQLVDGELFPSQMRIEVSSTQQIIIDVNFAKVQIELPVAFPFKIPDKYDKLF